MSVLRRYAAVPVVVACAVVAGAAPAATKAGAQAVGRSACYRTGPADPQGTYLQADTDLTTTASGTTFVTVTANAYGRARDCGPAGQQKPAPVINLALELRVTGEGLSCLGVENCRQDDEHMTISFTQTCHDEDSCRVSVSSETVSTRGDGHISAVQARSVVTNSGAVVQATTDSPVLRLGIRHMS